jgi:phosphoribosylformylglycinamidine synthase I
MPKKVGVLRFLGTNCDADVLKWVHQCGYSAEYLWFEDQFDIKNFSHLILPGGFSYGDYLRCGALAARSPVMKSVVEFAKAGKPILGICNGFQILCEAGLLPGVLIRNQGLKFKDEWSSLVVQDSKNFFGAQLKKNQKIQLPIAHGDGRFYDTVDGLKKILDQNQIWLKYEVNPNGALLDIAGIVSESGNVFGLMPHPERALYSWMGSSDGQYFL